ncbi:ABC transporter permease subunit [Pseudomonas putida]|uniref:ABC transporter permease subunit n=1 Tax=Pseudomonas putida TaxID=303 RepID=UPI00300F29DA
MNNLIHTLPTIGAAPAGPKSMNILRSLQNLPLYVWIAILVLLPNLLLVGVSLIQSKLGVITYTPTLENYQRALSSSGVWVLLGRTLATAGAATLIACLIAYPMAYYTSRVLRRGRMIAVLLVIIPLWTSLLMRIFAWRLILGESGVLNSLLVWSGILAEPTSALLYNRFTVLLTFVYVSIPFIFISVYSALERIPHNLMEAATDCGASRFRAFRTVLWPLSKPGLAIGASLSFLMAVGDYVTPAMVGGMDGTMLGTVIASQFGSVGNWSYGATLAIILLVAVIALLTVVMRMAKVQGVLTGESGELPAAEPAHGLLQKARRAAALTAFGLPYLFLYAPLVVIALLSFNTSAAQSFPMEGWSWRWYAEMAGNEALISALVRSLVTGAWVLLVSVAGGTVFAMLLAFGHIRCAQTCERLLLVPLAIPGVVLGLTLVLTFQVLNIPAGLLRVVLGHCAFVMPVILTIVLARLRRLDPALNEASTDLGATPLQTFWHVSLPLMRSAIIGGALLGFTLSVDEVVVTVFLAGSQPTLPVWVWNQMRFGFTPSVNAIFVCISVATIGLVCISRAIMRAGDKKA